MILKKFKKIIILTLIGIGILACSEDAKESNDENPAYKNAELSVEERVDDLIGRMTLEEKFWQMFMIPGDLSLGKDKLKHGIFGFQISSKGKNDNAAEQIMDYGSTGTAENMAKEINELQRYFLEESRLGIPIIPFNEALHGLARDGATVYPQAIALAATWDTISCTQYCSRCSLGKNRRNLWRRSLFNYPNGSIFYWCF